MDQRAKPHRAPALRISNIVFGRTNENGRVNYLVDPEGLGIERAIPEDVVLIRWRRRLMAGKTFHGCRLGPNLWRAVASAFGNDGTKICSLNDNQISQDRSKLNAGRNEHHLWLPDASSLIALFKLLGPERVQKILDRHLSPDRKDRFGTPDLFLFAKEKVSAAPAFFRLVEVKKPLEHISVDQIEEIDFLREIGVPARVLRLIERK